MSISTPSVRSFAYGIGCSLGDTVVTYTLTAARWGVLCWDFFSQPQAIQTYRWVGALIVALAQLVWWSAVWVYVHIQEWAEREVQSCIQQPPVVSVELMDIPTVSAPQDSPVSPASTPAGTPSRDALRKEAKTKSIPGYSRMTKPQLLEALGYF